MSQKESAALICYWINFFILIYNLICITHSEVTRYSIIFRCQSGDGILIIPMSLLTILRQLLKLYNYSLKSYEKYSNSKKYIVYSIIHNKIDSTEAIDGIINFD